MTAWSGSPISDDRVPGLDREMWERAIGPLGSLFDDSPAAGWRDSTVAMRWRYYLVWLGWLDATGALDATLKPAQRFTHDHIGSYVRELQSRYAPTAVAIRLDGLLGALKLLAPDTDLSLLQIVRSHLPESADASCKRSRLQETAVLFDFGLDLMRSVNQGNPVEVSRRSAAKYRDGLQIALLAMRPFRKGNFGSIELGRHLTMRGEKWWFNFEGDEVKNHRPIDVPFPDDLLPWLNLYLSSYRPLLAGSRYLGNRLWVSHQYSAESSHSIYCQVIARTEEAFGQGLNLHLFRDALATSLAINDPEEVGIAHAMLGNSVAVCQRYYNLANCVQAGRALVRTMEGLKGKLQMKKRTA